jgi:hypothetical protein
MYINPPSKRTHDNIDVYASWEQARLCIGIDSDSHEEKEEEDNIYLPPRNTPYIGGVLCYTIQYDAIIIFPLCCFI